MEAICNVDVCVWKRVSEIQLRSPMRGPKGFRLAPSTLARCCWSHPPQCPVGEDVESGQHPSSSSSSSSRGATAAYLSATCKMWSALHSIWMNSVPGQIDYKPQKN